MNDCLDIIEAARKTKEKSFYDSGIDKGRREVVERIQTNYLIPSPTDKAGQTEWQAKLKEWGIKP